ncbi:hypothetical protein PR048_012766 [Dryococelus australis]|uniref:DDE-1 domain-containing protein n=1 Tax=Dryococelus australis TaxID=614101 RepID=A0ABQ9HQX9_9NEOP|nr:hypothetical protein PR048_012766 [Dryococelus australis]
MSPEQVYNANETALYWRGMQRNTLCTLDNAHTGMNKINERLTVLGCSNAAGTHKLKLLVICKIMRPRKLRDVKVMSIEYIASIKAWLTTKITTEWFNSFVQQARQHCNNVDLKQDCKIIPPQHQGILCSLKCHYRLEFLRSFSSDLNGGKTIKCRLWQGLGTAFLNQLSTMPGTNCGRQLFTEENENEPADF